MTDDDIFALVQKGFGECGMKPAQGTFGGETLGLCGCALTAAMYALDGTKLFCGSNYIGRASKKLGRSLDWTYGMVEGFDRNEYRGDCRAGLLSDYYAGYTLGVRCRVFLPAEKPYNEVVTEPSV
jgi:hypothetical protein